VWETGFIVVVYAVNIGTVYPALTRNKALNVALRWREGRVVMEALEEILVVIIGTAKPWLLNVNRPYPRLTTASSHLDVSIPSKRLAGKWSVT